MSKTAFTKAQLKSFIERIERLEAEKDALAADIREVYAEAKGQGFDTKTMRQIVKDRAKDRMAFEEEQAMLELYRGALGLLEEPLSDNARRKASGAPPAQVDDDADDAPVPEEPPRKANTPSDADIKAAEAEGTKAAKTGQKVTENPYVYGDPRRMAWDQGWCMGSCSDGMEIPEAWRRSKPKRAKKKDAEAASAGDAS